MLYSVPKEALPLIGARTAYDRQKAIKNFRIVHGAVLVSLCTTIGVVLPSFIIILIIARLFTRFSDNKIVKSVFWGFKPVVAGLILSAAVTLTLQAILPNVSLAGFNFDFSGFDVWALVIFAVIFILSKVKIRGRQTHPFLLVISSAALGIIIYGAGPMIFG